MTAVMRSAVRDRIIVANACEGVRLPRQRRTADAERIISRQAFGVLLLPAVPSRWRALDGVAGGCGLRGECVGLRWDAVDLATGVVHVVRVAVEVAGHVSDKGYPKSRAGRRAGPLPPFVVELLRQHQARFEPGLTGEVFTNEVGGPTTTNLVPVPGLAADARPGQACSGLSRRPATGRGARRGPLRTAVRTRPSASPRPRPSRWSPGRRMAVFGSMISAMCTPRGSLSDGVPINDVQRVMGHEQASTTLNMYTHAASEQDSRRRLLGAFAAFSLPFEAVEGQVTGEGVEADAP